MCRCFVNWSEIYSFLWMPLAWLLIASGAAAADVVVVEPGDDLQGVIIRGRGAPRPFVVELAAGRHELSQPLILTEADSGLTLRGPEAGAALLVGSVAIKEWTAVAGRVGLFEAPLPERLHERPPRSVGVPYG